MAKNDNLTDFLTNVADCIRYKKGTTGPINPQNFGNEILSLGVEGGEPVIPTIPKKCNFYDYDGALLYSYIAEEFLALSDFPELPTQQGLTCQGWNWTLEDAKEYVMKYGKVDVGATYITNDGKTRLYITIVDEGRMEFPLRLQQSVANSVVIDWGDGSATETFSDTSSTTLTHTYSKVGDYVITLCVISGTLSLVGSKDYGIIASPMHVYSNMLHKVEIGNSVTSIGNQAFEYCYSLASIVIPNSITSIGEDAFYRCYSLSSIVLPNNITHIGKYAFQYCHSLSPIVIPNSATAIEGNTFQGCYSLSSIVIPNGVTFIGEKAFQECSSLSSIVLPNGITHIGKQAFGNCYSLSSIVIPNSVISIYDYAFQGCYSLSSIVIPNGVTYIGLSTFHNCNSLSSIVLPNGIISIGVDAFYCCYSLSSIVLPNSLTGIENDAFKYCRSLSCLDFRTHTSVPVLLSSSAFEYIASDCKIIVPDELYDEWIAAANWSTYASQIVKASEFNG